MPAWISRNIRQFCRRYPWSKIWNLFFARDNWKKRMAYSRSCSSWRSFFVFIIPVDLTLRVKAKGQVNLHLKLILSATSYENSWKLQSHHTKRWSSNDNPALSLFWCFGLHHSNLCLQILSAAAKAVCSVLFSLCIFQTSSHSYRDPW